MGERRYSNGFPASRQRVEEMLGRGDAFAEVERFIQASSRSREERGVLWVFAWLEQRRVARERGGKRARLDIGPRGEDGRAVS